MMSVAENVLVELAAESHSNTICMHNTMPVHPTLSICISTHNRAAFIGETLSSILCQVTTDCEIVVSDNASIDNTEAVVSQYVDLPRFSGRSLVSGLRD